MHDESRDDAGHDLSGDGLGAVEALLAGGDPRSLRNAAIVIDAGILPAGAAGGTGAVRLQP